MTLRSWVALGCGALLIAATQVVPTPPGDNPPIDPASAIEAHIELPETIAATLDRSCMDCHSNRTRWPWYSRVAPGSWLVRSDVATARSVLNLSEWTLHAPTPEMGVGLLAAACASIQSGRMPPPRYLLLHPSARLSDQERDRFCKWAQEEIGRAIQSGRTALTAAKTRER
jgi:hypothetical protein